MQIIAANLLWSNANDWVQDEQPTGIQIRKNKLPLQTPFIQRLRRHEKKIKGQYRYTNPKQRASFLKKDSHVYILKDELTNELVRKISIT